MHRILGNNLKCKEKELMVEIIWKYHTWYLYFNLNVLFIFLVGVLPEGIVHELPVADEYTKPAITEIVGPADDLEELRRQLEALNAD